MSNLNLEISQFYYDDAFCELRLSHGWSLQAPSEPDNNGSIGIYAVNSSGTLHRYHRIHLGQARRHVT